MGKNRVRLWALGAIRCPNQYMILLLILAIASAVVSTVLIIQQIQLLEIKIMSSIKKERHEISDAEQVLLDGLLKESQRLENKISPLARSPSATSSS